MHIVAESFGIKIAGITTADVSADIELVIHRMRHDVILLLRFGQVRRRCCATAKKASGQNASAKDGWKNSVMSHLFHRLILKKLIVDFHLPSAAYSTV
jgi:hypothetical protein